MKIELSRIVPIMSQIRFVLCARTKDATRYALDRIIIDPDCIWCTDGHVLHVLYCYHEYEVGQYEVLKATKTSIILLKYDDNLHVPNWRSIVPFYGRYIKDVNSAYSLRFTEKVLGELYQHGIGLPLENLKPLSDIDEQWDIFYDPKQKGRPVKFVSSNYQSYHHPKYRLEAVIMPYGLEKLETTTKAVERHNRKIA